MESLDRYLGALIDVDGARYRLNRLDPPFALLAKVDRATEVPASTEFVRMRVDDVAEAMTVVVVRQP